MSNPYEKRAHVFTPEVIAEMAKQNKEYRENKYPILKDFNGVYNTKRNKDTWSLRTRMCEGKAPWQVK